MKVVNFYIYIEYFISKENIVFVFIENWLILFIIYNVNKKFVVKIIGG